MGQRPANYHYKTSSVRQKIRMNEILAHHKILSMHNILYETKQLTKGEWSLELANKKKPAVRDKFDNEISLNIISLDLLWISSLDNPSIFDKQSK